jgi:YgiT-type zinc finger domain-containing protein
MKCLICKLGETRAGETAVTLRRGESTIIFKNVPADVCDNCREYYLSEAVTGELLKRAEAAVKDGAELEIMRYDTPQTVSK